MPNQRKLWPDGSSRWRGLSHVAAAKALSEELGGADQEVKEWFFSLSDDELSQILSAYGRRYGARKRQYAEFAYPLWRSATRKMSGLVAERLFDLLPRYMPLGKKYDLVRRLWEAKSPSSKLTIYVSPDVSAQVVAAHVRHRLHNVVSDHRIPAEISERFDWLAQNDAELRQQLCNHYQQLDKDVVARFAESRFEQIIEAIRGGDSSNVSTQVRQVVRVGKHEVIVCFDSRAEGISETPPTTKNAVGCMNVIAAGIAAIWYWFAG